MVLVYCTSSEHTLSQRSLNKIPSTVLELCPEQENLTKGDNSKRKQDSVKVFVYSIVSQCILSVYEVSTNPKNRSEAMHRTIQLNKGQ